MRSMNGKSRMIFFVCVWLLTASTLFHASKGGALRFRLARDFPKIEARSSDDFAGRIGIHTQLYTYKNAQSNFDDIPNADRLYENILRDRLKELGVRHLRLFLPAQKRVEDRQREIDRIKDLLNLGIRVNVILDPKKNNFTLSQMRDIVKQLGPVVESIEGPNEWDTNGEGDWLKELHEFMREMRKTFKSDPETEKLPILGPTFTGRSKSGPRFSVNLGDFSTNIDYGSLHMYDYPIVHEKGSYYDLNFKYRVKPFGKKPIIATETGYSTGKTSTSVSERVQAKYLLRRLFQYYRMGMVRIYTFNLIDLSANPMSEYSNTGLLRHDGSKKPAFTAEARLLALLQEPGATFVPQPLAFHIKSNDSSLRSVLLQKSNGDYYLATWLEIPSREEDVARPVELMFDKPVEKIEVYDPMASEKPVKTFGRADAYSVEASDRVLLFKIVP